MGKYIIKRGDTLSKIAQDNNTTVPELAKVNKISNPNLIMAGATLEIPTANKSTVTFNSNDYKPKSYSDIDLSKYDSGYKKSDDVIAADSKKAEAENAVTNYGDFKYSNDAMFKDVFDKIMNREKFSYDLNGDALYQQYKDKYIQQGKMAMQDTMGQAAAMTGGYGNSYAASVGNQAYQASLENLNDIVPELYQMAYDKYNQEGQDLYNQYSMLSDDRGMEYGMWGDKYNRLVSDRDYYGNEANNAYAKDYGQWADQRDYDTNQYWNETDFGYGQDRDKIADEQWEKTFNEGIRQYNEQMDFQKQQYADSKKLASVASGGKVTIDKDGNYVVNDNVEDSTNETSGVNPQVIDKVKSLKTNNQKADYLAGLVNDGIISQEEAQDILAENQNTEKDLKDRTWKKTKDTFNWFWGVDDDDEVTDQYGNKYRLDDLIDKLVAEGMSKKEAKAFVKKFN